VVREEPAVSDPGLEETHDEVRRYLARTKLSVVAQENRILRLKRLGLPTDDASDTLDALKGTGAALANFERVIQGLRRGEPSPLATPDKQS
jgi:hypothetical protein